MCDISKPIRQKTKVIYKVACKTAYGEYYSPLAGLRLSVGTVAKMPFHSVYGKDSPTRGGFRGKQWSYFNSIIIGRTTGLSSLRMARYLEVGHFLGTISVILKIKLGGSIYEGTASTMSFDSEKINSEEVRAYAGTEILSMEEVK